MHDFSVAISSDRVGSRAPGGIGRYATELIRALRSLDRNVEVISPPGLGGGGSRGVAAWQFLGLPRLRTNSDVVHATSLAIPPTSKPLVVTVHDLIFEKWPQAFTRWGIAFHERGIEIATRHARLVITPTESVAQELVERHPDLAGRVVAIHHGVPSFCRIKEPTDAPVLQSPAGAIPSAPYFFWVGTIEPRKNLGRLVQAFSLLVGPRPDIRLVIAGRPGWKIRPRALLRASSSGRLDGRVVFIQDPGDSTLRRLYRDCTALVFPSVDEGFGFPVLEAMALGAPVIASDIPSLREVADGASLLVDPRRAGALAEAMEAVLDDSSLAERLRKAGANQAGKFSWETSARFHLEAYQRAIGR